MMVAVVSSFVASGAGDSSGSLVWVQ